MNSKSKLMKSSSMKGPDKGKKSAGIGSGHAGHQVPGQSASGGTSSGKFPAGGKNAMFPKGSSKSQSPC